MSDLWPVFVVLPCFAVGYLGGIVLAFYAPEWVYDFRHRNDPPDTTIRQMPPTAFGVRVSNDQH